MLLCLRALTSVQQMRLEVSMKGLDGDEGGEKESSGEMKYGYQISAFFQDILIELYLGYRQ